jgi:hypothetical protein
VLYSARHATTTRRAWSRVTNQPREHSSNPKVKWNDSATALSRAEPVRPIDWTIPTAAQTRASSPPLNSPP